MTTEMRHISAVNQFVLAVILLLAPGLARAADELLGEDIAFIYVCPGTVSACYQSDVLKVPAGLGGATGANVRIFRLTDTELLENGAAVTNFGTLAATFDQIWVMDISAAADDTVFMLNHYGIVADWFTTRVPGHVIADARAISSFWNAGACSSNFTMSRPENALAIRFATALREVGGGLVLLTDSDAFVAGINEINQQVGIGDFYGLHYSPPYLALLTNHSLWIDHPEATYTRAELVDSNGLIPMHFPSCDATCEFLCADSSTGFVPVGAQPGGRQLYAVAHNNGDMNAPTISTTIPGAPPLTAAILPPGPQLVFADDVELTGMPTGGTAPFTYEWSDSTGTLGTTPIVTVPVPAQSTRDVTLLVRDSAGRRATAVITVQSGQCAQQTDCPTALFCVDGVCCNEACGGGDANDCLQCDVTNGQCQMQSGVSCEDGDLCTGADMCLIGTCMPAGVVMCANPTECQESGVCQPSTGDCVFEPFADDTPCTGGTCEGGVCVPDAPDASVVDMDGGEGADAASGTDASQRPDGASVSGDGSASTPNAPGGGTDDEESGCGCQDTQSRPASMWMVMLFALMVLRRRMR